MSYVFDIEQTIAGRLIVDANGKTFDEVRDAVVAELSGLSRIDKLPDIKMEDDSDISIVGVGQVVVTPVTAAAS